MVRAGSSASSLSAAERCAGEGGRQPARRGLEPAIKWCREKLHGARHLLLHLQPSVHTLKWRVRRGQALACVQ